MATAARFERQDEGSLKEELLARVAQLDRDFRLLSVSELCGRVDAIRQIARANAMLPLERLAAGLRDALARDGRGGTIRPFLDSMREALAYGSHDEATAQAFLVAVSARLSS